MGRIGPEHSGPWFDRELRHGRRVVYEWRPEVRFGPTVTPSLRGRALVNGIEFPDEDAAARFDLGEVEIYRDGRGTGWLREFDTWEQSEAWAREGG